MGGLCTDHRRLPPVSAGAAPLRVQAHTLLAPVCDRWLRIRVRAIRPLELLAPSHLSSSEREPATRCNSTIATLVFGEAYPQSASWERIETEALIVGASTMVAFVLVYLTTQAPFPVFVFGGYFGATLGASIMLLAAPTLGSPCTCLRASVGFLFHELINR